MNNIQHFSSCVIVANASDEPDLRNCSGNNEMARLTDYLQNEGFSKAEISDNVFTYYISDKGRGKSFVYFFHDNGVMISPPFKYILNDPLPNPFM